MSSTCGHTTDYAGLCAVFRTCQHCNDVRHFVRLQFATEVLKDFRSLSSLDTTICSIPWSQDAVDYFKAALQDISEHGSPKVVKHNWRSRTRYKLRRASTYGRIEFHVLIRQILPILERFRPSIWDTTMRLDAVKWLIASHAKVGGTIYHQLPSLRAQLATVPRVQLPTRVLDLRPSSFSSDRLTFEDMRLLISNGETMGHYMTLSHRWGEAHNLELTRENLPAFTKRIEFRHLPRTYEHAVIVARSLGFRYLWIDALCIIQHDEHDWLRESAKMATIYHNASCNIAAHTALDDSHGFLWPVDHISTTGQHVENFAQSLADSAIMKRGWVFQERILSKRIIHFARGTSFFEDASGVIKPDGIAPENYDPITNNKMNLEDGLVSQDEWYHLVERFTTCNLTFETDRLPAVAGLSEYYAQQTIDGKYLWGLWSGSFHQGLLWVTTAQDTNELLEGYRAAGMQPPSWSWARWAGKIRYPYHLTTCLSDCRLIEAQSNTESICLVEEASPASPKCLSTRIGIHAKAIDWNNVIATLYHSKGLRISFEPGLTGSYRIRSGSKSISASLDGKRDSEIQYAKLTLALVAHHEHEQYRIDTSDDHEDKEVVISTLVNYLLLLQETSTSMMPNTYRRIGLALSVGYWRVWEDSAENRTIYIE